MAIHSLKLLSELSSKQIITCLIRVCQLLNGAEKDGEMRDQFYWCSVSIGWLVLANTSCREKAPVHNIHKSLLERFTAVGAGKI